MPRNSVIASGVTDGIVLNDAFWKARVEVAPGVTVANGDPSGAGLYGDGSALWRITNFGTITGHDGVRLLSGSVVNHALISSVRIASAGPVTADIDNRSEISNIYGAIAINGLGPGAVSARITNTGDVRSGRDGPAIDISGKAVAARIDNHGSITVSRVGTAISIQGEQKVSAVIRNDGLIDNGHFAGAGIRIGGGNVSVDIVNGGSVLGGGSDSSDPGVDIGGRVIAARLVNHGLISGRTGAVKIAGSGPVSAVLINDGAISGLHGFGPSDLGIGLKLAATGGSGRLDADVVNAGSIQGVNQGVAVSAGSGLVDIANQGTISGGLGMLFEGAVQARITNSGTIAGTGGTAIRFGGGEARLIVKPGAVFAGEIAGGTGAATLELDSGGEAGGTIGGVTGFTRIDVEKGATWSLTGGNSLGARAGIDLDKKALLSVAGRLDVGGDLGVTGQGVLGVAATGSVEIGASGAPAAPGTFQVNGGATLSGSGNLRAAFVDDGTIEASCGRLTLDGDVTGSGVMFLHPDSALSVTGTIDGPGIEFLAGGNELLTLGSPYDVLSTVSGFGAGDFIDLLGVGKAGSASFAAGVLRVDTAGGPLSLHFAGSYSSQNFTLSSDHRGGTEIGWHV